MTYRVTIGIDPGQTGAIAVLADGAFAGFYDMPTVARPAGGQQVNGAELAAQLREIRAAHPGAHVLAVLERVSAMPGQGVSSMFRFGESFGVVKGVLAAMGWPLHSVSPAAWKRRCGLIGADKDCARTLAIQLFPAAAGGLTRKKDVGRADALLIADDNWRLSVHGEAA